MQVKTRGRRASTSAVIAKEIVAAMPTKRQGMPRPTREPQRGAARPNNMYGGSAFAQLAREDRDKDLAQACLKYQYVTAEAGPEARGPSGENVLPTVVLRFNAKVSFAPLAYAANVQPTTDPGGRQPMLDEDGNMTVVILPHILYDWKADTVPTSNGIVSTVLFGSERSELKQHFPLSSGSDGGAPYWGYANGWDNTFPSLNLDATHEDFATTDFDWRTIGLRATLSTTSNAFVTAGSIWGMDTGAWYSNAPTMMERYAPNDELVAISQPLAHPGPKYMVPVNPRANVMGPIVPGKTWEAAFVPVHNRVLNYVDTLPSFNTSHNPDTINDAANMDYMITMLSNYPALAFGLRDVPPGQGFLVDVSWVVECTVKNGTSLGFLQYEAKLARSYLIDWSALALVPTCGELGAMLQAWLATPEGKIGYDCKTGKIKEAPARTNVNVQTGAASSTSFIKRLFSGQYNKQLSAAADAALTWAPRVAALL